jgi:uncharacterized membrane protein
MPNDTAAVALSSGFEPRLQRRTGLAVSSASWRTQPFDVFGLSMNAGSRGYDAPIHCPRRQLLPLSARKGTDVKTASLRTHFILAALLGAATPAAAQPLIYQVTSLGGSPFESSANGINAAGQVVGTKVVGYSDSGKMYWQASRWSPGSGWQALGAWSGDSTGEAINDAGDVVGYNYRAGQAFRWTDAGGFQGLPGDYGIFPSRINNAGQVLGAPFVWDAAGTPQIFTLGTPNAINDRGQIAGLTGEGQAFVWTPGEGMTTFSGGGASTVATDINDRGQVVGHYDAPSGGRNGFLWSAADGFRPFDRTVDGSLLPQAINDTGTVVGRSDAGFGFVWTAEDGVRDLNTLLDPADPTRAFVTSANDINDVGQIVADAGSLGLLLTPVPEPGTLALFALGLFALRGQARLNARPQG